MAINAASKIDFNYGTNQRIEMVALTMQKIACAHSKSPVARLIERNFKNWQTS
jgi:hypothetical protein